MPKVKDELATAADYYKAFSALQEEGIPDKIIAYCRLTSKPQTIPQRWHSLPKRLVTPIMAVPTCNTGRWDDAWARNSESQSLASGFLSLWSSSMLGQWAERRQVGIRLLFFAAL